MKTLRRLGLSATLVCVLATVVFAECEPPKPGQTNTPPCAEAQIAPDNDAVPNSASPQSSAAEAWVVEVTIDLIESALSIF